MPFYRICHWLVSGLLAACLPALAQTGASSADSGSGNPATAQGPASAPTPAPAPAPATPAPSQPAATQAPSPPVAKPAANPASQPNRVEVRGQGLSDDDQRRFSTARSLDL
ncbi:MAG: hypothetical protein EBS75_08720 [Betaproteobacteria bacterium]|nr:hypothetical protein [Betaproteobacteria bacterium]